ncbi:hypothetical protein [Tsuneonella mangrovi]|uniref:hypothetical protein n=1 Tax=Tsuneonella mangrovi TaxID=1982042 RepID=UPI0012374954|nr:hypothetical protein [Tsuneonella mangrovi]
MRSREYLWLAVACAAIAIIGFAPTYWLQLPAGTFNGPPLLQIHGVLSTAWVLFLIMQAWLGSQGRMRSHRSWGLAGISFASLVVVIGYVTAISSLSHRLAQGGGNEARAFLTTPLSAMTLFAIFTGAAIACVNCPELHKRLMLAGTISLIDAAAARFAFLMAAGFAPGLRPGTAPLPPEAMPTVVGLLLQLLVVAGMIADKRRRGSVHPAWTIALVVAVATLVLKIPISHTETWYAFADWTTRIAG